MPIQKSGTGKPGKAAPAAKVTPKTAEVVEDTGNVVTHTGWPIIVDRHLTIRAGDGEFLKFGVSVPAATYDEAAEMATDLLTKEAEAVASAYNSLKESSESFSGSGEEGAAEEDASAEGEAEADEGDIGPDQIREMERDDLLTLIKDNGLEVDPKKFKSTKAGLDQLREAVIEAAGLGGEEAAEEGGEEASEETTEEAAEEGGEGEEVTYESVMAMDRTPLVELITANGLEIDPKKFPILGKLREKVCEVAGLEPAAEDEAAEEEAPAEEATYTRDDLMGATVDDLKSLWADWKIKDKFPTGAPIIVKKNAVSRLLQFQEKGK